MRSRPSRSGRAERGFALMEVMVASAILGVVALSLIRFWSVFDSLSFDLLLRQKAVFVLNGEMARLNNLYTTSGFGAGLRPLTTGYPTVRGISGSDSRLTYSNLSTGPSGLTVDFVVTSAASFAASEQAVLLDGLLTGARNYVWLDRDRQLMARIGWLEAPITSGAACSGSLASACQCLAFAGVLSGSCETVTLILDYPFALAGGAVVARGTTKTLTLSTIVGRRI